MKITTQFIPLVTLTVLLTACGTDTKVEQTTEAPVKTKASTTTYQKPGAPISMNYQILTQAPQPGDEIEIEVRFDSSIKSTISTKMTKGENLTLLNQEKSWQSFANKSGDFGTLPKLRFTADSEGIHYLNLIATVEEEGEVLSRPFIIPIKVGNGEVELESVGEVVTDGKGQKVIIQKAQKSN